MTDKKDELKRYRVLCWGACLTGACAPDSEGDKCGLEYQGKRYENGSVIELPVEFGKRHVKAGHVEETDLKNARGGVPVEDVVYVDVVDEGEQEVSE